MPQATEQTFHEELRFAVVLNGGVSLAVWMGGVAHELDQLTRRSASYGRLMGLLGVRARADVIAGTSAGGINGAALALAQVNKNADLSLLRDLWAEQGRMESLLQKPFSGSPSSLLRGNEYFLPKLNDAMHRLTSRWDPDPGRPIDLTITTTLLHGAYSVTADSFGQVMPQNRHDGRFRFFQGVDEDEADRQDFDDPEHVADALGLAARCSAGFPVAFEPSYVPVNRPGEQAEVRPDMGRYATWSSYGPASRTPADRSRFTVDGGLLANTPTRQALDAIQRMQAGQRVQRVMLLVYPHASSNVMDRPDQPDAPPVVTAEIASILGALTGEGSRTFVNEVEAHNMRAASRRGTRSDILTTVQTHGQDLHDLAASLFAHYARLRTRRAARDLSAEIEVPTTWSYERVRSAAEEAQTAWTDPTFPYVPAALPPRSAPLPTITWEWGTTPALDLADIALEVLSAFDDAWPGAEVRLGAARQQVHRAMSAMRAVRSAVDAPWREDPALVRLKPNLAYWKLRLDVYAWLMEANTVARARALSVQVEDLDGAAADRDLQQPLTDAVERIGRRSENSGAQIAAAVSDVVDAVARVVEDCRALGAEERSRVVGGLGPWGSWLGVSGDGAPADLRRTMFAQMVDLHVASWSIGDEYTTENTNPVDLVQVSAQTANAFADQSRTLEDKLGGASLARFSGFLKRSWRMNDWAWGRCDAASMLTRILLSPKRIRRFAVANDLDATSLVDTVVRAAFALSDEVDVAAWVSTGGLAEHLAGLHADAVREAERILRADVALSDLPDGLPVLTSLVAYARHADTVLEDLPVVAAAVRADHMDGANPRSRGELFVSQYADLLHRIDALGTTVDSDQTRLARLELGLAALAAFDAAGIGREPLDQEGMSDQMIRTAVTAASVVATVANSPSSGLGRLNPVTRTVKGAMLLPYWTTLGLTAGSGIARFLALMGLSGGAILLALSLLGVLAPPLSGVAALVGASAALVTFAYAALRTGTLLHGLVLLSAAIPLGWWGLQRWEDADGKGSATSMLGIGTVVVVLALVVALLMLGSLPNPLRSPLSTAGRLAVSLRTTTAFWVAAIARHARVIVGAVVVVAVLAYLWHTIDDDWSPRVLVWVLTAALGCVVGLVVAYVGGRSLRTWRWTAGHWTDPPVSHPAGVTVGWSLVYGLGYLLIGLGLWLWWGDQRAWIALTLALSVVLTVVVPVAVTVLARGRVAAHLLRDSVAGLYRPPTRDLLGASIAGDPRAQLVAWLVAHDMAYRYLAQPAHGRTAVLTLTRSGVALADKLDAVAP